jgi:C-terminal processing protease CtpA/Prc
LRLTLLLLQVVLVNRSTASTSELLAGALHDELSAPLIGTTTYGKGRSQRVVQLADGTSTLLVSTLKYFTPQHTEIDQVGLQPDLVCDPPEVVGGKWTGGRVDGEELGALSLLDDPCVKLAAEKLTGRTL